MPASRAEVWVTNPGGGSARDLVLGTKGLLTGTTAGDTWPAVPLAEVRMQAGPTFAPFAARAGQPAAAQPATAPDGWPLDLTLPRRTPALSGDTPAPQLRAMLLGPPSGPGTPAPGLPAASPGCIFLPSGGAWRRQITFEQNDAAGEFKLGSEVVDAAGHPFTDAAGSRVTLIPPMVYPHAVTWQDLMAALAQQDATKTPRHVCPRLGTQEVWELVNKTGEMHNFHIHQSKFRLADGNDRGAPPGLVVAQRQSCTASPEAAVCDPGNVIGQVMPEFDGAIPAGPVDVWHDTLPVPPMANETPGRVFVSIPFKAPEQLGRFVYHCHILEHEDGGMMAPVEVVRPTPAVAQGAPLPATLAATGQNLYHHH